jgi:hypothetical protein
LLGKLIKTVCSFVTFKRTFPVADVAYAITQSESSVRWIKTSFKYSTTYSESAILHSHFLHFTWLYALFITSWPSAKNNVKF